MNCSKCNLYKELSCFYPHVVKKQKGQCKTCYNEVQRNRRKNTQNAKDREYYHNNFEKYYHIGEKNLVKIY